MPENKWAAVLSAVAEYCDWGGSTPGQERLYLAVRSAACHGVDRPRTRRRIQQCAWW